jgi:hypothetical protein
MRPRDGLAAEGVVSRIPLASKVDDQSGWASTFDPPLWPVVGYLLVR